LIACRNVPGPELALLVTVKVAAEAALGSTAAPISAAPTTPLCLAAALALARLIDLADIPLILPVRASGRNVVGPQV
jgi:hypothetical protein